MKKAMFRKLRGVSGPIDEETNRIIDEETKKSVNKLLSDKKTKKNKKKEDK